MALTLRCIKRDAIVVYPEESNPDQRLQRHLRKAIAGGHGDVEGKSDTRWFEDGWAFTRIMRPERPSGRWTPRTFFLWQNPMQPLVWAWSSVLACSGICTMQELCLHPSSWGWMVPRKSGWSSVFIHLLPGEVIFLSDEVRSILMMIGVSHGGKYPPGRPLWGLLSHCLDEIMGLRREILSFPPLHCTRTLLQQEIKRK